MSCILGNLYESRILVTIRDTLLSHTYRWRNPSQKAIVMKLSSKISYWVVIVALGLAAMVVADQKLPPTQSTTPPTAKETVTRQKTSTDEKTSTPDSGSVNAVAIDVEIQRRLNEFKDVLDYRTDTINWWLTATAIFLAFLGIVVVLGGYIGFQRFEKIEDRALNYVEKLEKKGEKELERLRAIDAETFRGPEVERAVRQVQQNPEASDLDQAIADALTLQRRGMIGEAIDRWRFIANTAEKESDNDLAARAWFSIGYLLQEEM